MKKILWCLGFFFCTLQYNFATSVQIASVGKISNSFGLSGAFVGTLDKTIYFIGGSNFEQNYPWEGGKKVFHDEIYSIKSDGQSYECSVLPIKFPKAIAHGYAVSVGHSMYCVGGQTAQGDNRTMYSVQISGKNHLHIDSASVLPASFKVFGAIAIKDHIYLPGFLDNNPAMFVFDTQQGTWKRLAAYPGMVRQEGVIVCAQNNGKGEMIYLIGGRSVVRGELTLHRDVLEYNPLKDKWINKGLIHISEGDNEVKGDVLMAAGSVAYGTNTILVFGGDDGIEFERRFNLDKAILAAKDPRRLDSLKSVLKSSFLMHKGFSKTILSYHTITNTWIKLAQSSQTLPVVTSAVKIDDDVFLVSGEVKPAIRTPQILKVTMSDEVHFGFWNYLVVIVYLVAMLGMGFYFMRRNKDTDRFFKGGGQIPWWAAGVSIFATALSAITFLSIPAKAYATDWSMLLFNLMIVMVAPVVVIYYLPFFRKLTVASAYEYLQTRFSAGVRYLASSFFILFMFARIAIVLYLPSLALNAVTGLDINLCILLMGVVTLIYSTMGGIEAVVWGDFVQGIILVGGAIVSLVWMIVDTQGGLAGFVKIAVDNHKFEAFHMAFDLTQPVFWVVVVGGFANQLLTYTSDQSVIQRYITTSDMNAAKKSIWLNAWLSVPVSLIFFLIGTGLFTYFKTHPQDINVGMINADSVFPHFMMCRLPAGFAGLLIAAVFAAAMSTLASNINSISTAFTEDLIRPMIQTASNKKRMVIARLSGFIAGSLGIGIALLLASANIYSLWDQFNLFLGFFTSGLGGLFLMGIFTKHINTKGALCGFFGSMLTVMALNHYTHISFLLYGFVGLVSCFIIGYLSSYCFKK